MANDHGQGAASGPALVLIDWQQAFEDFTHWGTERNNPDAEDNGARLLDHWRSRGWPVAHVMHDSLDPSSPLCASADGWAIKAAVAPVADEPVFVKRVNSAFIGTDLDGHLRRLGASQLVIGGLTTDHCVSTSVRMASNLGYDVVLAYDACAAFDKPNPGGGRFSADTVHAVNLASLDREFCTIRPVADIVASQP